MHKLATGSYATNIADLSITVPGSCSASGCVLNDKDFLQISEIAIFGHISVYLNSTKKDLNKLALGIIVDVDLYKEALSSNDSLSKGQFVCYDHGVKFRKDCQSLSPINSFSWRTGSSKVWVIP
ncbi:MAG: hypothetical protein LBG46_05355 [Elusimicrobiota bacterium]|nr:hypothetical protein [Elusimicrobiota bacterium]